MIEQVTSYLQALGSKALYLGVSQTNPAVGLYRRLGFTTYHGIVMRYILDGDAALQDYFLDEGYRAFIRPATWGDYPKIQALSCFPCLMKTFDLAAGIYSSMYSEPTVFLSVFPSMMRSIARRGGVMNVLTSGSRESIVGIAHVIRPRSAPQGHTAALDFFVHDAFLNSAAELVSRTLQDATVLAVHHISFSCVSSDPIKSEIATGLGAKRVSVLPKGVKIADTSEDIVTYYL